MNDAIGDFLRQFAVGSDQELGMFVLVSMIILLIVLTFPATIMFLIGAGLLVFGQITYGLMVIIGAFVFAGVREALKQKKPPA